MVGRRGDLLVFMNSLCHIKTKKIHCVMFCNKLDLKTISANLHQNLISCTLLGEPSSLRGLIDPHHFQFLFGPSPNFFFTFWRKVAEVLKMRFMHCEKHIWLCAIQNIHRPILFCTIINPLFILREAGWLHKKTGNNFFWPFCTRFLAKEMPFEMSKNSYLQSFLPDTFTWSGADQPD